MRGQPIQLHPSLAAVRDHSRKFADFTFVYPIISRRSGGLSLGINLNPDKVCNFDCIYCEVDRRLPGAVSRVDLSQMKDELRAMIHFARDGGLAREPRFNEVPWATREVRDIAFSGDGEPTSVSNFAEIVSAAAEVKREAGLDRTKLVLITDAAGLDRGEVKRGLAIMDQNQGEVWAKLDAGTADYFRRVNRTAIPFSRILSHIESTARARPIVIQTLFLRIRGEGMAAEELEAYCHRLQTVLGAGGQIREVHAYTIARIPAEDWVSPVEAEELERSAAVVRAKTGLPVRVFP